MQPQVTNEVWCGWLAVRNCGSTCSARSNAFAICIGVFFKSKGNYAGNHVFIRPFIIQRHQCSASSLPITVWFFIWTSWSAWVTPSASGLSCRSLGQGATPHSNNNECTWIQNRGGEKKNIYTWYAKSLQAKTVKSKSSLESTACKSESSCKSFLI